MPRKQQQNAGGHQLVFAQTVVTIAQLHQLGDQVGLGMGAPLVNQVAKKRRHLLGGLLGGIVLFAGRAR